MRPTVLQRPHEMTQYFGKPCHTANYAVAEFPILGRVYSHRKVHDSLRAILSNVEDDGRAELIDMSDYGGCYNCRRVRGGSSYSPHAWAVAVDLNIHQGPDGQGLPHGRINFKVGPPSPQLTELSEYFAEHGWAWGGYFRRIDPMHFEATELIFGPPHREYVRIVVNGQVIEGAEGENRAGRVYARMGPVAAAIGVPCEESRVMIPVAAFLRSHGYRVTWHPGEGPRGAVSAQEA